MIIATSTQVAREGAPITEDPVAAFLFIWAVSTIAWMRHNDKKKPLIPDTLRGDFSKAITESSKFIRHYEIPPVSVSKYFTSLEYGVADLSDTKETLDAALASVRGAMKRISSDKNVTFDEIALLKAELAWNSTQNPTQLTMIRKLVTRIRMPIALQKEFSADVEVQTPYVEKLKEIVKQLTGKPGTYISMVDAPKYRESKPELWKAYLAAQKPINTIYKQELHNYLTSSNSLHAPIKDVRKHLESKGVVHRLPAKELDGRIDAEGRIYTNDGARILGVPAVESKIRMNPAYDPQKDAETGKNNNWVFQTTLPTKDAKGNNNTAYYYTEDKKKINKGHKFEIVQKMLAQEDKIAKRWRKDLASKDALVAIPAAQLEISYLTAARIGGADNENKHGKTYGLTTWLVGNVKKRGDSIIFDYIGKDSVHQTHKISPATPSEERVIFIVNKLVQGKKRADPLWEFGGHLFNDSKLRAYFKTVCTIPGATVHKIRHLRGTRLAEKVLTPLQESLLKQKKPVTQAQVDKEFKAALTKVGELLGHVRGVSGEAKATWSTASQSYIDPSVQIEFYQAFEDYGIRVPRFLEKMK